MKNARLMMVGFCILISITSVVSLSGCFGGYYGGGNRGYSGGEERHYYRDGNWYRRDPSGLEILVSALAAGAFIESLPPRHTTVVVEGASYYHDDRYYYKRRPQGGYVVVPEPVRAQSNRDEQRGRSDGRNDKGNQDEHR